MFSDEFQTIEARAEAVIEDRGSRFVGVLTPVDSRDTADGFLKALLDEHPDTLDFVMTSRIGLSPDCEEDAQGPEGANELVQSILVSRDITNAMIVVVRKPLGGKPLAPSAQAYRDAALNALRRAKVVSRILYDTLRFEVPRDDLEQVTRLITDNRGKIIQTLNGPNLTVSVKVRRVQGDALKKTLVDAMRGRVKALE